MPISLIAAFLGGSISLLSPCSALVIPTFAAAISGKKSHNLNSITIIFSLGLLVSLIPFALGAFVLSQLIMLYRPQITLIIGILLALSAFMVLFLDHLPFPDLKNYILQKNKSKSVIGSIFILGLISGLGASTCIGPILGAIISLGAASTNSILTIFLLIAYAAGIMFPLILFVLSYDSIGKKFFKKFNRLSVNIGKFTWPLSQFVSAILLLLIAYIFIWHQGTLSTIAVINHSSLFNTMLNFQNQLFNY